MGGRAEVTLEDAVAYVKMVKALAPEKYHEFLHLLEGFRATLDYIQMAKDLAEKYDGFLEVLKIPCADRPDAFDDVRGHTIDRVKELFKNHPDLILGYNKFLPEECQIPLNPIMPPPPVQPTVNVEEAIIHIEAMLGVSRL